MSEARYYKNIKQIIEETDVAKVNDLLSKGYELLTIKEASKVQVENGAPAVTTFIVYVLGLESKESKPQNIEWHQMKDNPKGALAYIKDKQGNEISSVKDLVEKIQQKGSYSDEKYIYKISKDGNYVLRFEKE